MAVEDAGGLADTIARLRRALRRAARAADPGNELAVAQLELLTSVAEHPGIRPGQVAKLLNLRPNSVTTLVNGLSRLDMISRGSADSDRRGVTLVLTERGRRAVTAWQATNSGILRQALPALNPQQRQVLGRALPALEALVSAIDSLADTPAIGTRDHHTATT